MPQQTATTTGNQAGQPPNNPQEYQKLVQRVADRVWQMWREEMRRERERRGNEVR
jgi:hypothetical protein